MLIAALALVCSEDPNYAVCHQYQIILRRLLDQTLEPSNIPLFTLGGCQEAHNVPPVDMMFLTDHDADFLEWLENLE